MPRGGRRLQSSFTKAVASCVSVEAREATALTATRPASWCFISSVPFCLRVVFSGLVGREGRSVSGIRGST